MGTPTWAHDQPLPSLNPSPFIHEFMGHCDLPLHTPACLSLRFASLSRDNTTCQSCASERLSLWQFASTERLLSVLAQLAVSPSSQLRSTQEAHKEWSLTPSLCPLIPILNVSTALILIPWSFINSSQQVTPLTCRPHQSPERCDSGYSFRVQIESSPGQGWCDPV